MAYVYGGTKRDLAEPLPPLPEPEPKPAADQPPFDPAYCGTRAGYQRHIKSGEQGCGACLAADRAYKAEWRAKKRNGEVLRGVFNDDACGEYRGYHRHRRAGIPPCDPCWQANADYMTAYHAKQAAERSSTNVSQQEHQV